MLSLPSSSSSGGRRTSVTARRLTTDARRPLPTNRRRQGPSGGATAGPPPPSPPPPLSSSSRTKTWFCGVQSPGLCSSTLRWFGWIDSFLTTTTTSRRNSARSLHSAAADDYCQSHFRCDGERGSGGGEGGGGAESVSLLPPSSPPDSTAAAVAAAAACSRRSCRRCRQRIRINIAGQHFEIFSGLLGRHPTTLLGDDRKRRHYYDRNRNEFFFDRHRPSFEAVFTYYQYGNKLRRPGNVPDDVFLAEVEFFQLEPEVVDEYKRSEGYTSEELTVPENATMRRLWTLFENPDASRAAYAIAVTSVLVTLVSIVLFCVETLDQFSQTHCVDGAAPNFVDPFFVIETVCTAWFTLELTVRFVASPSKLRFWRDFKNLVDLTAVVPYYVIFFNVVSTMNCATAKSSASLAFLRVVRLVRVFKLTKHSVGLQVLVLTVRASTEELGLFVVILLVCMLVYSSAIYFAELGIPESNIQSIPDAFWWAIITMTTVGYGDKFPVGFLGKVIGAACAITGVLTLAMPVPIITGHFNRFYAHKTGRGRRL